MGVRATVYSISADDCMRAKKGDASFECDSELELDKSWHAIHFLLTGDTELRFLADGVEVVEGGDFSLTAHSPEAVVDLGERVEALLSSLAQKFDSTELNKLNIYPGGWNADRSYVAEHLSRLSDFVARAAQSGRALAVVLC